MRLFDGKLKLFDKFLISGRSGDGDPYLTRWRIIDSPLFGIFVHKMHRPDASPILHDHPWSFVSFVLRGGYVEQRRNMELEYQSGEKWRRHIKHFNVKRLRDAHFIQHLDRTPTWTLVFVGRTKRVWGYWQQVGLAQTLTVTGGKTIGPGMWYRIPWMHHSNHSPRRDPFANDGE